MTAPIRAIVTDIEGTTTPIRFVTTTLFPFARAHLPEFVTRGQSDPTIAALLAETRELAGLEGAGLQETIAVLQSWIDADRKAPPLKALQGMIWAEGYADGRLKGEIYADAVAGLNRWHQRGIRLYAYSSGSVEAQKLIFGYSNAGDLTPLFQGYFDTRLGPKLAASSYHALAQHLGLPAAEILFLSDHAGELDAAESAGLATAQLIRDPAPIRGQHPAHAGFDTILP